MSSLSYTKKTFKRQHQALDRRLHQFMRTKRGRDLGVQRLKTWLAFDAALSLKAINAIARIKHAECLVEKLRRFFERKDLASVFFVTLIVREHAVPLTEASKFDVGECKSAACKLLDGLSFIGMVEAAYYYRSLFAFEPRQPVVAWHSHAIVWSADQRELAGRMRGFNEQYQAFVPGATAGHFRKVSAASALSYARYMSKSLLNEYTAYPRMRETVDRATGEILHEPSGKWRNRKRPIRPGNLAKAMKAMGERSLSTLSFAGGSGIDLRRRILAATRRKLRADEAARTANLRRVLFGTAGSKRLSNGFASQYSQYTI